MKKASVIRGIQVTYSVYAGGDTVIYLPGFQKMTVDIGKHNVILTKDDIVKAVCKKLTVKL